MTVRAQVVRDLESLSQDELEYAARLIETLRARSHGAAAPSFDPAVYGPLYSEFAVEDRDLAEQGMADYAQALEAEDKG
jgi:hypothetical protein